MAKEDVCRRSSTTSEATSKGEAKRKPKPKLKRNTRSESPTALLTQAEELLQTSQPRDALPLAHRALSILTPDTSSPTPLALPALTLLGSINLELGDIPAARSHFLQCASLDPIGKISGPETFLWLAQLSPEGGHDSVKWFEKGAQALRISVDASENEREKAEKMKKLASVLCAIVEVYMTDLSFDPLAEPTSESLITESLLLSPSHPEPLQTLASIRISQSRIPEARTALSQSLDLWKDLPPDDIEKIPDFPTRISLARLLLEVGMEEVAMGVVERLVEEDDQSVEAWYLGGWGLWLLGTKEGMGGEENRGEGDERKMASLVSSREWLSQSLALYDLVEYEDDRLRDHALELVEGLDGELGVEGEVEEENGMEGRGLGDDGGDGEEGDGESEDDEDEEGEEEGEEDEIMNDT